MEGLVFNDDQVLFVPNDEFGDAEDEYLYWKDFMSRAGLVVNENKSFTGKAGVFLEEYGDFNDFPVYKGLWQAMNAFYALQCPHIADAKRYIYELSNLELFDTPEFDRAIDRVIELAGFEFAPPEISYPYPIGWKAHRVDGWNRVFLDVSEGEMEETWWSILAVGPPPVLDGKVVIERDEWLGAPFSSAAKAPCNKGKWLARLLSWAKDRQKAFRRPILVDRRAVYEKWVQGKVDRYLISEYEFPNKELDKSISLRDLYVIAQNRNPIDRSLCDRTRASSSFFLKGTSSEHLTYMLQRSTEVRLSQADLEYRTGYRVNLKRVTLLRALHC